MAALDEFFESRVKGRSVAFADSTPADRNSLSHPCNRVTALTEDLRDLGIALLRFCNGRQHAPRVAGTDIRQLREIEDEHGSRALLRCAFESRCYALNRLAWRTHRRWRGCVRGSYRRRERSRAPGREPC